MKLKRWELKSRWSLNYNSLKPLSCCHVLRSQLLLELAHLSSVFADTIFKKMNIEHRTPNTESRKLAYLNIEYRDEK